MGVAIGDGRGHIGSSEDLDRVAEMLELGF